MVSFASFTLIFSGICGKSCMDYMMYNLIAHCMQSGPLQPSDVKQDM